jgi:hypothetical protein
MKAVRFHQFGGPEVLKYEDVPDPVLRKDQVLVRVKAVALNHLDLFLRKGLPGVNLPHIAGADIFRQHRRGGRVHHRPEGRNARAAGATRFLRTLRSVGREILKNHLKHCATHAITQSPERAEAMYNELVELFSRYAR